MKNIERFLNYVRFDTQSNPYSNISPSTNGQINFAQYLVQELKQIGLHHAFLDQYGYVYGYLESNSLSTLTIGLIAHMDTSFDASGQNIKPTIIEKYDGSDIILNESLKMILSPKEFPSLNQKIGHTIIHTDGTTLLGADDKAGITIIISTIETIISNNLEHPNIIITFTPDEEIGEGTKNFNAASAHIKIKGKSIHPGSAKGKMINSLFIGMEFQSMLPHEAIPSLTDGYEGFFHLNRMQGSVEETNLEYIIRNHNTEMFHQQKNLMIEIQNYLNKKYNQDLVTVTLKDSYYNMRELILKHPSILEYAIKAMKRNKINPTFVPIRGGTDGAQLSYNFIYTPNLGTGGENFHGPYEYLDVTDMNKMIDILITIFKIITEEK